MTDPRRTSRAFTVIEVMLALALSSIVVVAAISLYQVLQVSDRTSQARFEHAADLAVTQITLRKIMNTLLAAPAEPANRMSQPAGEPEPGQDGEEPEPTEDERAEDGEEGEDERAPIEAVPPAGAPAMFDLWWEEYEDERGRPVLLPVLELVVTEPPVALRSAAEKIDEAQLDDVDESLAEEALRRTDRLAESVRGRLECLAAEDGWRLYWRPIDPPARPFMLASGIASHPDGGPDLVWQVLSRNDKVEAWESAWTATLRTEFPLAVRLSFVNEQGRLIDWMFETHVTAPVGE